MSANPIEDNPTPKTTGSLEELFRHHLGEEAAVPPRSMLWDQIDNSLLVRQNELYRKRLVATRWVAAASLLLATLAGTGWWTRRDASLGGTDVAAVNQPAGAATGRRVADHAALPSSPTPSAADATGAAAVALASNAANGTARLAPDSDAAAAAQSASRTTAFASASAPPRSAAQQNFHVKPAGATTPATLLARSTVAGTGVASATALAVRGSQAGFSDAGSANFGSENSSAHSAPMAQSTGATTAEAISTTVAMGGDGSGVATEAAAGLVTNAAGGEPAAATVAPTQVNALAMHPAALSMAAPAALPNGLPALALPDESPTTIDGHRWHYGASYSASVFNPNIDFSRAGIEPQYDYNHAPGFGPQSPALTEAAAAQYRQNLRPGLSQRIALLASRHLAGHWSLRTGAEFAQATAQSATSLAFVGEQLPDVGQTLSAPLQKTNFRYQLASVPVEVRYSNPVKRGWSIYGHLGGVVSALLGVRSDVEGNPEATRTYSITSDGMPYRRVTASVRGGAGAQFRTTTGHWGLTMGPVAELGLVSMNAHPVQSYVAQSRPYSFGVEAGLEFGR